jgi:hypothetical protein
MKIYKTVKLSQAHLELVICDICNKESNPGGEWVEPPETAEVKIRFSEGIVYRDGSGQSKTYDFDLCPDCFKGKVIPALEAMCVKVEYEDFDW